MKVIKAILTILTVWLHTTNSELCIEDNLAESALLHREKRQLLFPNTTLLQLNIGMSALPGDIKTFSYNWAFQANFQLPWNRTQIPTDIFFANTGYTGDSRSERDERSISKSAEENAVRNDSMAYDGDVKLHHFYGYFQDQLDAIGHNGTACILRTLCQVAREPLHSNDDEDFMHELTSFLLNPNNDGMDHQTSPEAAAYVEAYNHGIVREDCTTKYKDCSLDLLDMFTRLHD